MTRVAQVVILDEENFSPPDCALFTHIVRGVVDTDALNTIHRHVVNWTLHPEMKLLSFQALPAGNLEYHIPGAQKLRPFHIGQICFCFVLFFFNR